MALSTTIISMLMLLVSVIVVQASNSLKNNPFIFKCYSDCSRYGCRKAKDVRDNCPGGTVYGVCGCCLRCAKLEGEECGDYKNMKGICDVGLYCHVKKRSLYKFASGICRSKFVWLNFFPYWFMLYIGKLCKITETGASQVSDDQPLDCSELNWHSTLTFL